MSGYFESFKTQFGSPLTYQNHSSLWSALLFVHRTNGSLRKLSNL